MSRRLFICHTVYHVYITLLKAYKYKKIDIALVDTIVNIYELQERLQTSGIFENVLIIDRGKIFGKPIRTFLGNYINNRLRIKKISKNLEFLDNYKEIYIFNDYSEMGDYLELKDKKYHLLEDGLDAFKQFNQYKDIGHGHGVKKILYFLFKIPYSVGLNRNCLDIEVNDEQGIQTNLIHPIIVQNREILLKSVTNNYFNTMLEIFNAKYINTSDNKLLLLTQILKEILVVNSDKEQIELYRSAIKKYGKGYDIYIKPHPRDNIDYSSIEKEFNAVCLDRNIPMEIYSLLPGMHFKILMTYSSTAANMNGLGDQIIRLDGQP